MHDIQHVFDIFTFISTSRYTSALNNLHSEYSQPVHNPERYVVTDNFYIRPERGCLES